MCDKHGGLTPCRSPGNDSTSTDRRADRRNITDATTRRVVSKTQPANQTPLSHVVHEMSERPASTGRSSVSAGWISALRSVGLPGSKPTSLAGRSSVGHGSKPDSGRVIFTGDNVSIGATIVDGAAATAGSFERSHAGRIRHAGSTSDSNGITRSSPSAVDKTKCRVAAESRRNKKQTEPESSSTIVPLMAESTKGNTTRPPSAVRTKIRRFMSTSLRSGLFNQSNQTFTFFVRDVIFPRMQVRCERLFQ